MKAWVRSEVVVSKDEESRAVKVITSSFGHDIDGSSARHTDSWIEAEAGNLKFLHCFLREVEQRAPQQPFARRSTVDGYARLRKPCTGKGHALVSIATATGVGDRYYADSGFK